MATGFSPPSHLTTLLAFGQSSTTFRYPLRQVLLESGEPIEHVYFPEQGMVSLVTPLEDGAMIEIGVIGREGMVGVPILLGATMAPSEAMAQIAGSALRITTSALLEEVRGAGQ